MTFQSPHMEVTFQARAKELGLKLRGSVASGKIDGIDVVISLCDEGDEHAARGRARVLVPLTPALDLGLHVGGFFRKFRGDEDDRAAELVGEQGLALLKDWDRHVEISDSDFRFERASLSLARIADLEEAIEWAQRLAGLAAAIERRRGELRSAAAVAPFEPALRRFAEHHGLQCARCPLRIAGMIPEGRMGLLAVRRNKGEFDMVADVKLSNSRLKGLSIRPHQLASEGEGEIVATKDAAFDRTFEVRAKKPKSVPALLDASTRAWFLEEFDRYTSVSLVTGKLRLGGVPLDRERPSMMAEFGEHLVEAARLLSGTADRSPYRA